MKYPATSTLRMEHEAILRMLAAIEETARRIEGGQGVAAETLSGLLEFLRVFADRCHHGKEEDLLFPMLEQKGMPRNGGPVGVMLYEHEQGRAFIRRMVDALNAYSSGTGAAAGQWAEAAHGYVLLLRGHIDKENQILFTMAERLLTDVEQDQLAVEFERLEIEKMGEGTHERLHALMDKLLAEIFPAAKASA
jgi:hemerythrin-like domain-containing protein